MLNREDPTQFHYYQPGIGTYVQSSSLSHSSRYERLKAAWIKAKDSAVGTSFGRALWDPMGKFADLQIDEHVMSGYRFLMRYYNVGDDIFLFGFSRGAYTARFLAEMLDHVGLLSAGNEEMAIFAWKAFERWSVETAPQYQVPANEMIVEATTYREHREGEAAEKVSDELHVRLSRDVLSPRAKDSISWSF